MTRGIEGEELLEQRGHPSESHVGVGGQARTVADCKICNNSSHSVQHSYCGIRILFEDTPTGQLLHHAISSKFRTEKSLSFSDAPP